jgi:hypothetical protein
MNEAKQRETKRSEEKQSKGNIYLSGMSELNARIVASIVFLKPVYSTDVAAKACKASQQLVAAQLAFFPHSSRRRRGKRRTTFALAIIPFSRRGSPIAREVVAQFYRLSVSEARGQWRRSEYRCVIAREAKFPFGVPIQPSHCHSSPLASDINWHWTQSQRKLIGGLHSSAVPQYRRSKYPVCSELIWRSHHIRSIAECPSMINDHSSS